MQTYLWNRWDAVRNSYWFVPALLCLASILLAELLPYVDRELTASGFAYPAWIRTTMDAARATLSTISASMVTVAGTVFSITVVTLAMASQQFGPRLLRTFMEDVPTQWSLGTFLATSVYSLLVLRVVEYDPAGNAAPHFAVLLAVLFALGSMATLIFFVHHTAQLIQAPQIVATVALDLDKAIERLFPRELGQEESDAEPASIRSTELGEDFQAVASAYEGYIQGIDVETLVHFAERHRLVLHLHCRPGHFIRNGLTIAHAWGEEEFPEQLASRVNDAIVVGTRRTPRQDVECSVNELVEVAVRSLSPGINDPFTAMNCVDRLSAALAKLAQRALSPSQFFNQQGRLVLVIPNVTFADVLDAALNQIRQYGRESVAVNIRMLEALASVGASTCRDADRQAVLRQADMILASCEELFLEGQDLQVVRSRYNEVSSAVRNDRV